MTTSGDSAELRELDRDLPTTAEDVAMLRRLRPGQALSFDDYLQGLAALQPSPAVSLRSRSGPSGAPFDLIALWP